jgi:hypothetical protein
LDCCWTDVPRSSTPIKLWRRKRKSAPSSRIAKARSSTLCTTRAPGPTPSSSTQAPIRTTRTRSPMRSPRLIVPPWKCISQMSTRAKSGGTDRSWRQWSSVRSAVLAGADACSVQALLELLDEGPQPGHSADRDPAVSGSASFAPVARRRPLRWISIRSVAMRAEVPWAAASDSDSREKSAMERRTPILEDADPSAMQRDVAFVAANAPQPSSVEPASFVRAQPRGSCVHDAGEDG